MNRVKSKYESLLKTYKVHTDKMAATGGGLGDLNDIDRADRPAKSSGHDLYIPPDGPQGDTPIEARNLWGKSKAQVRTELLAMS